MQRLVQKHQELQPFWKCGGIEMKVEYVDDVKCAKCYACGNYTVDQMDRDSEHCIDCGWLDEESK